MNKILLVGCGAMGSALKQAWQLKNKDVMVVDPHLTPAKNVVSCVEYLPLNYQPDIILFAIKPQHAAKFLPLYAFFKSKKSVFVSIMAGISIFQMQEYLGIDSTLVRSMPNLPCLTGQGMTGLFTPFTLEVEIQSQINELFSSVGITAWVEAEDHLNIVTALSGSGPAYFFHLTEMMSKAGQALGLSQVIADQLARQTLVGAGSMLEVLPDSALQLQQRVTSPGGTTAAAIEIFDHKRALESLVLAAMKAAYQRGKELSL